MRIVLAWVGALVVVAGAIIGGVAIANATVFSASSFVRDYLDALHLGRVAEVLSLPGVQDAALEGDRAEGQLLDPTAGQALQYSILGSTARGGVERITVSFTDGDSRGTTTLEVTRIGSRFLLFPRWGFAEPPVTRIAVTVSGDSRFTVGDVGLEAAADGTATVSVLTPGIYRFGHDSTFLAAAPVDIVATGAPQAATLAIEPTAHFTEAAQTAVEADLTACAEQTVLFPRGCPFGFSIENRVISTPQWTISQLPTAVLAPSDRLGVWAIPHVAGVAHLRVEVQSLFDGSTSTLDEDVPFEASYLVGFDGTAIALTPVL